MKKPNHLVDVTNITAEEYDDSKVLSMEDLMEIPAGALFEQIIRSIFDPTQGNGQPACFKIRNNGVIVTMLIGILDTKTVGVPKNEVIQ